MVKDTNKNKNNSKNNYNSSNSSVFGRWLQTKICNPRASFGKTCYFLTLGGWIGGKIDRLRPEENSFLYTDIFFKFKVGGWLGAKPVW